MNHNKQLGKNSISNLLVFALNTLVNIWMVPYLVNRLGVSVYGTFPLALSLFGFLNLATYSLNNSASRYLTLSIQKSRFDESNVIFNTSLFGNTLIIILLLPIGCTAIFSLNKILTIPLGYENDVYYLYLTMFVSFIITSLSNGFTSALYSINRIDLKNISEIFNNIVRALFIVILFNFMGTKVYYVGMAYLIGALFALIASVYLFNKYNPYLTVSCLNFDIAKFKILSSLGFWIVINQLGSLLFLNIDLIVVSKLFGSIACGQYASVLQWSILLRTIASILAASLTPLAFIHYASDRHAELVILTRSSMKLIGLSMALIVGIISGGAHLLLRMWLGPEFERFGSLLWIQSGHLVVNLAVLPLFAVNITLDKVKTPGLLSLVLGLTNVALAVILGLSTELGIYGVALAGAILLTCKNAFFTTWYCAKILNVSVKPYMNILVQSLVAFVMVFTITFIIIQYKYTFITYFLFLFGLIISYFIFVWKFFLTANEKNFVLSCIPIKLRSKRVQENV